MSWIFETDEKSVIAVDRIKMAATSAANHLFQCQAH